MRSPLQARRGSVTAEWALALPAVTIVVWLILAGLSVAIDQSRVQHAAADAARLLSLGVSDTETQARTLSHLGDDYRLDVTVDPTAHQVCALVERTLTPAWRQLLPVIPQSTHCALDPGGP